MTYGETLGRPGTAAAPKSLSVLRMNSSHRKATPEARRNAHPFTYTGPHRLPFQTLTWLRPPTNATFSSRMQYALSK